MREFRGAQHFVRKNLYVYLILRKFAPLLCNFFDLEDGFSFLSTIQSDPRATAIDVGSNDGTSISLISKHIKGVRIHCFDPVRAPITFRLSTAQVFFNRFGLSDKAEHSSIYVPVVKGAVLTQYSSIQKDSMVYQLRHDLGLKEEDVHLVAQEVEFRRMDDLALRPFFIKVDVEGSELNVLRGGRTTLVKYLPIVLVEIQNSEIYDEIASFFRGIGYSNYIQNSSKSNLWRHISLNFEFDIRYNNYLWLPNQPSSTWEYK